MLINDIILWIVSSWIIPLGLFVVYFVTDPVKGRRWRRKLIDIRSLTTVSKILLAQKLALLLIVAIIVVYRFTGGFPGWEWMVLSLYVVLVSLGWAMFFALRSIQRSGERRVRSGEDRADVDSELTD